MRLRIDELAAESGITSRTIRAYQNRGLLPAPELDGRTGFYNEEHLQRLAIIADLQYRGFSLAAIHDTLEVWARGGNLSHLLGLRRVLAASAGEEVPEILTADELAQRFPSVGNRDQMISEAVEVDVLVALPDGRYEVPSPVLLEAGRLLADHHIPITAILDTLAAARVSVRDIATAFVSLIMEELARPILAGTSDEDPERAQQLLAQLVPLAGEVLRPLLAQELPGVIASGLESLRLDTGAVARTKQADPPPG